MSHKSLSSDYVHVYLATEVPTCIHKRAVAVCGPPTPPPARLCGRPRPFPRRSAPSVKSLRRELRDPRLRALALLKVALRSVRVDGARGGEELLGSRAVAPRLFEKAPVVDEGGDVRGVGLKRERREVETCSRIESG